jgi:beta-glucosidase
MTSYNLINSVHAANNHDLCIKPLRNEWDFKGLVITDWSTSNGTDNCFASKCINTSNDIMMPGTLEDLADLGIAENKTMKLFVLKYSVTQLVDVISNQAAMGKAKF